MRIGFIGAGKVAVTLGKYINEGESNIVSLSGYYSKTVDSALYASKFTHSACFSSLSDVMNASDIIFLTVPDNQLHSLWNVCKTLSFRDKILCHCSGAWSSLLFDDIADFSSYGYSIHPLFAIHSKETSYLQLNQAFFTIEGHEKYMKFWLDLFQTWGNSVKIISPEHKVKYHASAVFSSNLVLASLKIACELLEECGFSSEEAKMALSPIALHNVENFSKVGLAMALTGPVERGDFSTVGKHLSQLNPKQKEIYALLSQQLLPLALEKNPQLDWEKVEQLEQLLQG